jgi:hypothetical protein
MAMFAYVSASSHPQNQWMASLMLREYETRITQTAITPSKG